MPQSDIKPKLLPLMPLVILISAVLASAAVCGIYIYVADRICPVEHTPAVTAALPLAPRSPLAHLIPGYTDNEHQQRGRASESHGGNNQDNAAPSASVQHSQTGEHANKRQGQAGQKGHEPQGWFGKFFCEAKAADVALVFFTMCLVIVTAWLACATLMLWSAGEQQIGIARDSADAARASVDQADKALKITQRAYIGTDPAGVELFTRGPYYACDVYFKNVGNLPARNVKWFLDKKFTACETYSHFPTPTQIELFDGSSNVLPPGTSMRMGGPKVEQSLLESEHAKATDEVPIWLYVWGEIRYDDGFGKPRFTKFCHRYNLLAGEKQDPGGLWIKAKRARFHIKGNDGD